MTGAIVFLVALYAMLGILTGVLSLPLLDDAEWCPAGAEPAIAFVVGALWPVTAVAGAGWGLWRIGRTVAGGFAALWRHRQRMARGAARRRASS